MRKRLERLLDTQEVVGSSPIPPTLLALVTCGVTEAFFMSSVPIDLCRATIPELCNNLVTVVSKLWAAFHLIELACIRSEG